MRFTWKTFIAQFCQVLGVLGWIYIGCWQVLKRPIKKVIVAQMAGSLSVMTLCGAVVQAFLFLSLAGAVWCAGYILKDYFLAK